MGLKLYLNHQTHTTRNCYLDYRTNTRALGLHRLIAKEDKPELFVENTAMPIPTTFFATP